jgi:hypothetical protein
LVVDGCDVTKGGRGSSRGTHAIINCLFGISHGRHLVGTLALELAGVLVGKLRPPIKHRGRLLGLHAKTRRREKHGVLLFEARQAGIYISLECLRMNCSSNNAGHVHGSNPRHRAKTMQPHDHIVPARGDKTHRDDVRAHQQMDGFSLDLEGVQLYDLLRYVPRLSISDTWDADAGMFACLGSGGNSLKQGEHCAKSVSGTSLLLDGNICSFSGSPQKR